jgi:hypothetical protein
MAGEEMAVQCQVLSSSASATVAGWLMQLPFPEFIESAPDSQFPESKKIMLHGAWEEIDCYVWTTNVYVGTRL